MRTSASVLTVACFIAALTGEYTTHGSEVNLLHANASGPIFCPCNCSACSLYILGAPSRSRPSSNERCIIASSSIIFQDARKLGATWQALAGPSQRRAVLAVGRQRVATPKKKATPKPLTPRSYGLQGGQTSCKVLTPGRFLIHWRVRIPPCAWVINHKCQTSMVGHVPHDVC